ncbi:MAG: precorrin-2 C(20)-methyltransferase [Methanomassiliicoccaceae archaeon]|jgi:precorrin-2/cobalt-factor-2 C20-methyltransferase|nr:precorrin-2 C(20)-methyltransferase [Methanomassiliicoccaceae archaeon]
MIPDEHMPVTKKGMGKLYGVGIGPGDPDLMTLKAKRILEGVRHIIAPVKREGEDSTALNIIGGRVDLSSKVIHKLVFLMEGGRTQFRECGRDAGNRIMDILGTGEDAAMITLGDVSVFSTYMYLSDHVEKLGFETEIIPGISSFSNAAALAKIPLVLGDEGLAIIPAAKMDDIDRIMDVFENIVIMKAGGAMMEISEKMAARDIPQKNAVVVSRAGMTGEYIGPVDVDREFNYFTTLIMKR